MLNHLPAESLTAALGDSEEREVTRYLVMTVKESSEETQVANQLWEGRGMFEVFAVRLGWRFTRDKYRR